MIYKLASSWRVLTDEVREAPIFKGETKEQVELSTLQGLVTDVSQRLGRCAPRSLGRTGWQLLSC